MEEKKKQAYSIGLMVAFLLAVMTIGEFFVGAIAHTWGTILLTISALKAFFVIRDYMHIDRLFAGEEETH